MREGERQWQNSLACIVYSVFLVFASNQQLLGANSEHKYLWSWCTESYILVRALPLLFPLPWCCPWECAHTEGCPDHSPYISKLSSYESLLWRETRKTEHLKSPLYSVALSEPVGRVLSGQKPCSEVDFLGICPTNSLKEPWHRTHN